DYAIHGLWGRPPTLAFTPLIASKIVLSQDNYYAMPRSVGATSWLPDCSHWCISNSSRSSVPVARISLGALRRYWHPVRNTITSRIGPPLKLPSHLLLSPASWRLFWSLSLPAKAFTPWWRLLHDRIGHRSWCHRIVPDKVLSPVCALCGIASEDLYHFVVGCPYKADYWRDVVSLLSLWDLLPTSLCIWTALTGFCSLDMVELDEDVLVALGAAYTTLWKYHWRSVIDTEPWIPSVVLNMVRQDHGSLFHSLFPSAGVQTGNLTLYTLIQKKKNDLAIRGLWGRPPSLAFSTLIESNIVLSRDTYYSMPRSAIAASWLPDCSHWPTSNSSCSSVPIARISLGVL
ncbi:hypothetical protein INT46_008804, partial [Mucor plumbeus]